LDRCFDKKNYIELPIRLNCADQVLSWM